MQITEEMITPHHLAAAERWIAANGMPATDADMARMGSEVAQEAYRVVEHMSEKAFAALDAHYEDKKAGAETLAGMQGQELLHDIYSELRRRARGGRSMVSGWISVEERLPDPGQLVLVYTPPQSGDWPDCLRVEFDHIDEDSGLWYEHAEHYEHFCCVDLPEGSTGPNEAAPYTHWMPLPAPPHTATRA